MDKQDLRREVRIPVANLPEQYSSFTVLQSVDTEDVVNTTDASLRGFGFISEMLVDAYVVGTRIILYPFGQEKPVYGKVVFSKRIDNYTRVGVELMQYGNYELYKKEMSEIINNMNH